MSLSHQRRAQLFRRAGYRCELCGCPEGRMPVAHGGLWADEKLEETFEGVPFRAWRDRAGQTVLVPGTIHVTQVRLHVFRGRSVMCDRCVSFAYKEAS